MSGRVKRDGMVPKNIMDEIDDSVCVLCFKDVNAYSFGLCDHPVCYECSARMRVLCKQNECPICRQDMPVVIFSKEIIPFRKISNKLKLKMDPKYKICFDSDETQILFSKLLEHSCTLCGNRCFDTFALLKQHIRRSHQLNYCDLCVDNLKIFSFERKFYTRHDLVQHRKKGDPDDKSHKGHPLCEFCDIRFMDNDELYRHLRRDHLYCHICDADGLHQYYSSYNCLRDHYRKEHFLCEEGNCVNEQFTSVFRTQIDFKAHKSSMHGHEMGKYELKQTRSVALEFTLVPRERPPGNTGSSGLPHPHRSHYHRNENGNSVAVEDIEPAVSVRSLDTGSIQEFPCLGGMGGTVPTGRGQASHRVIPKSRHLTVYDENFPALGPSSSTAVSLSVSQPPSTQLSIRVHSKRPTHKREDAFRPESYPSLGNSMSNNPIASWTAESAFTPSRQTNLASPRPASAAPRSTSAFNIDTTQFPSLASCPNSTLEDSKKSKGKKANNKSVKKCDLKSDFREVLEKPAKKSERKSEVKENQLSPKGAKRKEKNNSKKLTDSCISDNILNNADDFPSLSSVKRPPPGFALPQRNWSPPPVERPTIPPGFPPPGFTPSPREPSHQYVNPRNFSKRNKKLLSEVQVSVGGEEFLSEFRKISTRFRNGDISAGDYVEHCLSIMGKQAFSSIFPELLVLLPDISKQKELWGVIEEELKKKLVVCTVCGQVVLKAELNDHKVCHSTPLDLPNFPPLPCLSNL